MAITISVSGLPVMSEERSSKLEADIIIAFNDVKKRFKELNGKRPMCSFTPELSRRRLGENIFAILTGVPRLPFAPQDLAATIGEVIHRRFPRSHVAFKVYSDALESATWSGDPKSH